ncbi:hypothetical protein ACF061_08195 [Streptomyces sp. NPDC015220]|uniref:hypothetical protein n=1 Tax=Streptomyces sp. NPDC015220 TaxID=3364947 RepID=UPI0036FD5569
MQLNQVPGDLGGSTGLLGTSGGQKDLASSPAEKQAAARAIEQHIEPDTRKAGDGADEETVSAVKAFSHGWLTSGALKKAHDTWDEQVRNLMNRLASDKGALRGANTTLQKTDSAAGAKARSVSVIDEY